jgi:hypothetical protein
MLSRAVLTYWDTHYSCDRGVESRGQKPYIATAVPSIGYVSAWSQFSTLPYRCCDGCKVVHFQDKARD